MRLVSYHGTDRGSVAEWAAEPSMLEVGYGHGENEGENEGGVEREEVGSGSGSGLSPLYPPVMVFGEGSFRQSSGQVCATISLHPRILRFD